MRLANRDVQRIYIGLKKIDEAPETTLDGEVRVRIGVNLNRLFEHVRVVDKETQRLSNQMALMSQQVNGQKIDTLKLFGLDDELQTILDTVEDFKLKKFRLEEFKLKQNPKIKAEMLSQIAILIKDFDDGESDED